MRKIIYYHQPLNSSQTCEKFVNYIRKICMKLETENEINRCYVNAGDCIITFAIFTLLLNALFVPFISQIYYYYEMQTYYMKIEHNEKRLLDIIMWNEKRKRLRCITHVIHFLNVYSFLLPRVIQTE